jgi:hypothetical protein
MGRRSMAKILKEGELHYEAEPPVLTKCCRCRKKFTPVRVRAFFTEFRPMGPDHNEDGNFKVFPSPTCQSCWEIIVQTRGTVELDIGRLMKAINLEDFNI